MKKTIIISTMVVLLFGATATAQKRGNILAGGGLGYATEINNLSIFANGVYQITDEWEGSLGITYFLPKKENGGSDITWLGFDLDAHYVFSKQDNLDFYGLAGLHITRVSTEFNGVSFSDTNTGLNLGAGGRYQLTDNLYGIGEAKYVLADGGFFNLNVGVLFRF